VKGPIVPVAGGVRLLVEVTPGASRDEFPAGFDTWRGRIKAKVSAPASDGKANRALVELVGRYLAVPASAVEVEQGATDRRKTVLVRSRA
jgi:uncharacterized protein (TIGR00251 family)